MGPTAIPHSKCWFNLQQTSPIGDTSRFARALCLCACSTMINSKLQITIWINKNTTVICYKFMNQITLEQNLNFHPIPIFNSSRYLVLFYTIFSWALALLQQSCSPWQRGSYTALVRCQGDEQQIRSQLLGPASWANNLTCWCLMR